jgi:Xaa-Pro aminopeptidase
MPWLDELEGGSAQPMGLSPQLAAPVEVSVPTPPIGRLFAAALGRENIVGSFAESFAQPRMAPFDPAFDPWRNIAGYEDNARAFLGANSEDDVANIKARIDAERRREEYLNNSGALGLLMSGAATLLDPTILLPVGGQYYAVSRTGRALQGMFRTGVASGAATAVQETGLQGTQLTRPLSESAVNVGVGTIVGSALGGAVAAYGGAIPEAIARQTMREGEIFGREVDDIARGYQSTEAPEGSVSAAATRGTTRTQETLESALGAENVLAQTAPNLRPFVNSPSVSVPQFMQELSEIPATLRKHAEGIPSPRAIETDIRMADGPLMQALQEGDDLFIKYRLGKDERSLFDVSRTAGADIFRAPPEGKLDYHAFNEEIGKAMRRNDEHPIPEVAAAAKAYRQQVIEPWKQRAIEAGLFDEDVSTDTALSYFMRVYNTEKIIGQREDFTGRIVRWLTDEQGKKSAIRRQVSDLLEEQRELSAKVKKRVSQIEKRERALRDVEIRREEVSRLNAFAFRRASALSKPVDELRSALSEIETRVAPLIGAAERLKEGDSLVDLVRGSEELGRIIDRAKLVAGADDAATLTEARSDLGKAIRPYRKELRRLQGQLKKEMRARSGPARGGAVFETEIRRRGNTLADQATGREAAIEGIDARLGRDEERLAAIQGELERLVGSWEGKTSRVAKGALARRVAKEATRDPGKGRPKEADRPVIKAAKDIAKASTDLSEDELRDTARQIIDRILGSPVGRLPYDIEVPEPRFARQEDQGARRGPLASRAFKIPDEMIEDYLESDARLVSRLYSRTMAADVSLVERFGRVDMEDQFKAVMAEYDALRKGKSEAELKKLDRQMRADLRDLAAVRDRLRRTYALPDNPNGLANRAFSVIRDINYLRLLGGMTLASLGDLGRTVMVHGVTRVARDAVVPMLTNFRQLRIAAGEAKLAGAATDMVMDTRSMAMADIMDDYGRWSRYERGLQALSSKFGLITLMAPWNSALKQISGVIGQTRTLRAVEQMVAGRALSKAELTRLSWLGIGDEGAERIATQFKEHGVKDGSLWWANTEAWTDPRAVDAFRAALSKEINTVIVQPGMEVPLAMAGAWGNTGKLLFQFKGYAMASTQRVLLTGLQRRDMATLNGVLMMTGLGALSYYLRHSIDANPKKKDLPDPSTPEGLAQWLREGVDRAGVTGWLFDLHNTVEKATGGAVGLQRVIGDAPSSRYSSRGVLGAIAGPTGGLLEDAGRLISEGAQGELSEAGVRAMRRLMPLQNAILGPRQLFDQAEEGLHQALGTR